MRQIVLFTEFDTQTNLNQLQNINYCIKYQKMGCGAVEQSSTAQSPLKMLKQKQRTLSFSHKNSQVVIPLLPKKPKKVVQISTQTSFKHVVPSNDIGVQSCVGVGGESKKLVDGEGIEESMQESMQESMLESKCWRLDFRAGKGEEGREKEGEGEEKQKLEEGQEEEEQKIIKNDRGQKPRFDGGLEYSNNRIKLAELQKGQQQQGQATFYNIKNKDKTSQKLSLKKINLDQIPKKQMSQNPQNESISDLLSTRIIKRGASNIITQVKSNIQQQQDVNILNINLKMQKQKKKLGTRLDVDNGNDNGSAKIINKKSSRMAEMEFHNNGGDLVSKAKKKEMDEEKDLQKGSEDDNTLKPTVVKPRFTNSYEILGNNQCQVQQVTNFDIDSLHLRLQTKYENGKLV